MEKNKHDIVWLREKFFAFLVKRANEIYGSRELTEEYVREQLENSKNISGRVFINGYIPDTALEIDIILDKGTIGIFTVDFADYQSVVECLETKYPDLYQHMEVV